MAHEVADGLRRAEGFRVYTPEGHLLGLVEEVRLGSSDEPDHLVVRGGVLGVLVFTVLIEDVTEVQTEDERISVRTSPVNAGLLEDLRRALGIVLDVRSPAPDSASSGSKLDLRPSKR